MDKDVWMQKDDGNAVKASQNLLQPLKGSKTAETEVAISIESNFISNRLVAKNPT